MLVCWNSVPAWKSFIANRLHRSFRPSLIIDLLVQIATYQSELIRLLDVGLLEQRPRVEIVYRKQIAPIFQAITDYLDACVKSGVLRDMDPSLTTIALSTTVLAHQCLYGLVSGAGTPYLNRDRKSTRLNSSHFGISY